MQTNRVLPALFTGLLMLTAPAVSSAGISLSITVAPPVLRVYEQPLCPTDGYLWQPGYWNYGNSGYYWVPGIWVAPPSAGMLWTPPYWGFAGGFYGFHGGYWGSQVGFYGGINYGFGYGGSGYNGGAWQNGHFAYNTAVTRVNTTVIHNTYNRSVTVNNNHTSFNGPGGVTARPTAQETAAGRGHEEPANNGHAQTVAARPATAPSRASNAERPANHPTPASHPAPAVRTATPVRETTQERPTAAPRQTAQARPAQQEHAAPAAAPRPAAQAHAAPAAHPAAQAHEPEHEKR